MTRWAPFAACLLLLLFGARTASAHAIGLSRGEYRASPVGLDVDLVFAERELASAFDDAGAVLRAIAVTASGEPCAPELLATARTDRDGLRLRARYVCTPSGSLRVVWNAFDRLPHGHRHIARTDGASEDVHFGARRTFDLGRPAPATSSAWDWLALGVHHIVTGYDHLVFLLALVLVAKDVLALLRVISCFTIAHSLTLCAATLGLVAPPALIVEPAIALSIAYVGVENLIARRWKTRTWLVFAFGLVHGFGFAGVLSTVELPPGELPFALVLFNLGVELGQVACIAAVYPLVRLLAAQPWFTPRLVPVCSAVIVVLGLGWFVERVVGN